MSEEEFTKVTCSICKDVHERTRIHNEDDITISIAHSQYSDVYGKSYDNVCPPCVDKFNEFIGGCDE